jgi:hypothetical protein
MKDNKRKEGLRQLEQWHSELKSSIEAQKASNKALAQSNEQDQSSSSKNPWERVFKHIEIKEEAYVGTNDVSRMRASMIARRNDLKK